MEEHKDFDVVKAAPPTTLTVRHLQPQSNVIIREATGILGHQADPHATPATTETPCAKETDHKSPSTNYITICPPSLQTSCTFV
jgi:hypothetical protein